MNKHQTSTNKIKKVELPSSIDFTATVLNVYEEIETETQIWEHDLDDAHDLVTKFPVKVKNQKIEAEWEFQYCEDTDDIPTDKETERGYNPPEYFFRVIVAGVSADSILLAGVFII